MNMSIENIMVECDRIAVNELKDDIDLQYSTMRAHELKSGNHDYSKKYNSNKNRNRDTLSGRKIQNPMKNMDDAKARSKMANMLYKSANLGMDGLKYNRSKKKATATHESSIFESLLNQV
jgi:hypothetical protein